MTTLIWPRSCTVQTTKNLPGQCPRVCVKLKSGNALESQGKLKKIRDQALDALYAVARKHRVIILINKTIQQIFRDQPKPKCWL